MSGPDYDTHYAKHCARYYGWLPASREHKRLLGKRGVKYFTLCARQALDIFMLELEGVFSRDQDGKLPNVVICECDPMAAVDIRRLVRPPLEEAILVGKLEEILLFEDTPETRGLSLDEDYKNQRLRQLLNLKRLSKRIQSYFPFDIINFDPCGNFLNPELGRNNLCQSFERILELQEPIEVFLLFITTPIFDIHPDFHAMFKDNLESNVATSPEIRNALVTSVGSVNYDEIDQNKKIALGFAKAVVASAARTKGWDCEHLGIYVYESPSRSRMLNSVVRFSKAGSAPNGPSYVRDVVRIIQQMPQCYSHTESLRNDEVRGHLERVKAYREQIRDAYRE